MTIDEETKGKIIDLYCQHKTIREIANIVKKSSRDITAVLKEHKIRQAQKYTADDKEQVKQEKDDTQSNHDEVLPNVKAYKLFSEICSQIRMLETFIEQLKNGQSYQEIEQTATDKVSELLIDNKKLLQYALVSVIEALRNEPDRYPLIDKMPITTTTIQNYNSLAARQPTFPQGDEQFVRERVLELADRIFDRFQKVPYQQLQDWKREVHILPVIIL